MTYLAGVASVEDLERLRNTWYLIDQEASFAIRGFSHFEWEDVEGLFLPAPSASQEYFASKLSEYSHDAIFRSPSGRMS